MTPATDLYRLYGEVSLAFARGEALTQETTQRVLALIDTSITPDSSPVAAVNDKPHLLDTTQTVSVGTF